MKTQPRPTLLFVLTLAAIPAASLTNTARAEITETFSQSFTLAPGGAVSLANMNGPARFIAAPEGSNELRVEGIKRGDTPEDLQAITIEVNAKPDAVRVTTRFAKDGAASWSRGRKGSVDYTVTVPRGAKLEAVKLTNGSLTLEALSAAAVEASCVNGKLLVTDLAASGPVTLGDVNGSMEVSLRALPAAGQAVEIKNVNGAVQVTLPAGAGVSLSAKTVNGSISTNAAGLAEGDKSLVGRKLAGRIGDGSTPMQVSTVNGSISVTTKP